MRRPLPTRELVAPAYFSACLRRSLVTLAASAASACVGDRLTAAYKHVVLCNCNNMWFYVYYFAGFKFFIRDILYTCILIIKRIFREMYLINNEYVIKITIEIKRDTVTLKEI